MYYQPDRFLLEEDPEISLRQERVRSEFRMPEILRRP